MTLKQNNANITLTMAISYKLQSWMSEEGDSAEPPEEDEEEQECDHDSDQGSHEAGQGHVVVWRFAVVEQSCLEQEEI